MTLQRFTIDFLPASLQEEVTSKYPKLFDKTRDRTTLNQLQILLKLQVSVVQAGKIFAALDEESRLHPAAFKQVLNALESCAKNAMSDMYNSTGPPKFADQENAFSVLHAFSRVKLRFDPVPLPSSSQQIAHEMAKSRASKRDGDMGDAWSGALCALTGLPHAELAHLMPQKTAAASGNNKWCWLWFAIVLLNAHYRAAWQACGGHNLNALANTMSLCTQLHRYYDQLTIAFQPILRTDISVGFEVEVQSPHSFLTFFGLRDRMGNCLAPGSRLRWEPRGTQYNDVQNAPSLLLLSLHRYIVFARALTGNWSTSQPAQISVSNSDYQQWQQRAGKPRSASASGSTTPTGALSPSALPGRYDGVCDDDDDFSNDNDDDNDATPVVTVPETEALALEELRESLAAALVLPTKGEGAD